MFCFFSIKDRNFNRFLTPGLMAPYFLKIDILLFKKGLIIQERFNKLIHVYGMNTVINCCHH